MKRIQKTIGVMLSLIMLLSVFAGLPVSAAPTILASGEVGANGSNVIWTLTSDDVLTLSGTGKTADYSYGGTPWFDTEYCSHIKTVVVEEGITRLGSYLFYSCDALVSARLPDSLESIGDCVFSYCSLTELPNLGQVTVIPSEAFSSNPMSETLTIPDGITKICDNAFNGCVNVKNVVLPDTVETVEHYVFEGAPVKSVVQPASILFDASFDYNSIKKLTLIGDPVTFSHGRFIFLSPEAEVTIPTGCSYAGLNGLFPVILDESKSWHQFDEAIRYFIEDLGKGDDVTSSYNWNLEYEDGMGWTTLREQNISAESPLVIGADGTYPNVFGKAKVNTVTFTQVPANEASCDADGNITYYVGSDSKYYKLENGEFVEIDLADTVISGGHIYGDDDWTPATPADCGNDGVLPHFTCTRCSQPIDVDGNVMDSIVDPATGAHDWIWVTDELPGCYTDGAKHEYCTVCGKTRNEGTPIPAAHVFDAWVDAVAPTCGSDGTLGHQHCHVCGDDFDANGNKLDSIVDPATGNHTTTIINAREATATEDGYTGDEVCTVCGQTVKTGEVIPAAGEPTPDEPDDGDVCPYCGRVHTGKHAKWIRIVHLVFAFLLSIFRTIRK